MVYDKEALRRVGEYLMRRVWSAMLPPATLAWRARYLEITDALSMLQTASPATNFVTLEFFNDSGDRYCLTVQALDGTSKSPAQLLDDARDENAALRAKLDKFMDEAREDRFVIKRIFEIVKSALGTEAEWSKAAVKFEDRPLRDWVAVLVSDYRSARAKAKRLQDALNNVKGRNEYGDEP